MLETTALEGTGQDSVSAEVACRCLRSSWLSVPVSVMARQILLERCKTARSCASRPGTARREQRCDASLQPAGLCCCNRWGDSNVENVAKRKSEGGGRCVRSVMSGWWETGREEHASRCVSTGNRLTNRSYSSRWARAAAAAAANAAPWSLAASEVPGRAGGPWVLLGSACRLLLRWKRSLAIRGRG